MCMKYASLHRSVLHVHCHLFFMFHYTELYFMYIVTSFFMFHYTQLYFMYIVTSFFIFHYTELFFRYIVTSFLYFTTQSCISCTFSPLFLTMCMKYSSVVKHKKEVTMYMKYSSVVKHKKEVTMYMTYSCV
jgi:hypothetical protein